MTDDVKEDWFLQFKGNIFGPNPNLIKEFKDNTKHNVYIYTLDKFLTLSDKLEFQVKNETLQEIEHRKSEDSDLSSILYYDSLLEKEKGETLQSTALESVFSPRYYTKLLDDIIEKSIREKMGCLATEADNLSQTNDCHSSERESNEEKGSFFSDDDVDK